MFTRNRVRLALAVTTPFDTPHGASAVMDFFLNATPLVPHGRAVAFEVALFQGAVLDAAIGLDSLTLEIKNQAGGIIDTGAAVASRTVSSATFNALLDAAKWQAGTDYYAAFEFSEAEMNLDMSSGTESRGFFTAKQFGLVVSGLGPNGRVDCGAGLIYLIKSGATGLGSGVPPVVSYGLSDQEILAGIAGCVKAGVNPSGTAPIFASQDDPARGLMLTVRIPADGGDPVIEWVPVVVPS